MSSSRNVVELNWHTPVGFELPTGRGPGRTILWVSAVAGGRSPTACRVAPLDVVRAERIELVSLTRDHLAAILDGRTAEVEEALEVALPPNWFGDDDLLPRWRLEQIDADPTSQPWLLRALILVEPRTCVGYFNFHGPPGEGGWVEMGYEILPEHRRRGYASEAALRMMRWAHDEHGVEIFRASIGPPQRALTEDDREARLR
jgi:[ribosomal protein S5]-alanine N-acetyltransferase